MLRSLVGPACIFLRPSIAATQLVCTAASPPAAPSLCSSLRRGAGLSGEAGAKAHRSRGVRGRETQRSIRWQGPQERDFEDPRAKPEVLSNLWSTSGQ